MTDKIVILVLAVLLVAAVAVALLASWRAQLRIQQVEAEREAARTDARHLRRHAIASAALGQDIHTDGGPLPGELTGPSKEEIGWVVDELVRHVHSCPACRVAIEPREHFLCEGPDVCACECNAEIPIVPGPTEETDK
jgi:hypothetical protein